MYAYLSRLLSWAKMKVLKSLFVVFTVTMFTVFAQHKSTAALTPETTVIVNAVMFTAMHVVTTFVHV